MSALTTAAQDLAWAAAAHSAPWLYRSSRERHMQAPSLQGPCEPLQGPPGAAVRRCLGARQGGSEKYGSRPLGGRAAKCAGAWRRGRPFGPHAPYGGGLCKTGSRGGAPCLEKGTFRWERGTFRRERGHPEGKGGHSEKALLQLLTNDAQLGGAAAKGSTALGGSRLRCATALHLAK